MKTGNTAAAAAWPVDSSWPQWSPVMKTGNTSAAESCQSYGWTPQWSPVMKTGNTRMMFPPCGGRESLNGARS